MFTVVSEIVIIERQKSEDTRQSSAIMGVLKKDISKTCYNFKIHHGNFIEI